MAVVVVCSRLMREHSWASRCLLQTDGLLMTGVGIAGRIDFDRPLAVELVVVELLFFVD